MMIGNNIIDKIWFNYAHLPKQFWTYSQDCIFANDFFALFAVISKKNCLWKYWLANKDILLSKLIVSYSDKQCLVFDLLCPFFQLYKYGYEGISIKKHRIHKLWLDIIERINICPDVLTHFMLLNHKINIPYIFLQDIYKYVDIDFGKPIMTLCHNSIMKNKSIYNLLTERTIQDNFYFFHKNVLKKRMIYIILSIYKRFGLFKDQWTDVYSYRTGIIIMNYLQNNIYYLT